jgi:hypothetical protein
MEDSMEVYFFHLVYIGVRWVVAKNLFYKFDDLPKVGEIVEFVEEILNVYIIKLIPLVRWNL